MHSPKENNVVKNAIVCLIGLVFVVSVSAEPLLEGRVRLESGKPVADAQVRLFDLTDLRQGAIARALTDGTGYFALPLAALEGRALPARFALGPNYPNPFNPSTIIPYRLAASSQVRLEVFNLLGQRIATLVDGERAAGFHTVTWNATDAAGRAVGAGVYIYRMTVGETSQTGRMVLIDGQAGVAAASGWPSAALGGEINRGAEVYGLIVSGEGLVPYVDSAFRVEAGMAPVELIVSAGQHSAGKATDDDLSDLFGVFGEQQEEEEDETPEEEETDSTSNEGGPDLIVQSPSASAVVLTPGQAFTLQVTVHNQGDQQAAATMLHYYRSNNATITASDTEVGTGAVDALAVSATSEQSIELTASVGVERYYGACVASVDGEINTDNNCSSAVKTTVSGQETPEEEKEETPEEEEEETPDRSDDHSNTRSDATSLALGSSLTGQIDPGSDVDYFSVQVSESGTLTVYTTGSLDTKGKLESSSGSRLASNDDGGSNTNFRIERSVSADTYYIKVESYRSRTGSYTIHASFSTAPVSGATGDSGGGDNGNGDSSNGDSGNGDSGNGDSGNGGTCTSGSTISPGGSCTYRGDTFSVSSSGMGSLKGIGSERGLHLTGYANGVEWDFIARKNPDPDNSWTILTAN